MSDPVRPGDKFGKDFDLIHKAIVTARRIGAGELLWSKLAHDEAFFLRVVDLVHPFPKVPLTVSQKIAQEIMGDNYYGPDQVTENFHIRFTDAESSMLADVPFPERVLATRHNTHILILGYPLSILDMRTRAKGLFDTQNWYLGEVFAREAKPELRWYLVLKTAVEKSFEKTWTEQLALLETSFVPQVCVMVYTIILHYLATGERLFERHAARCESIDSSGNRVCVGLFGTDGLRIFRGLDDRRDAHLGLAAA